MDNLSLPQGVKKRIVIDQLDSGSVVRVVTPAKPVDVPDPEAEPWEKPSTVGSLLQNFVGHMPPQPRVESTVFSKNELIELRDCLKAHLGIRP